MIWRTFLAIVDEKDIYENQSHQKLEHIILPKIPGTRRMNEYNHFLKIIFTKTQYKSSFFVDMINLTFFSVLSEVFGIADVVGINMPNLKILKIC